MLDIEPRTDWHFLLLAYRSHKVLLMVTRAVFNLSSSVSLKSLLCSIVRLLKKLTGPNYIQDTLTPDERKYHKIMANLVICTSTVVVVIVVLVVSVRAYVCIIEEGWEGG